MTPINSSLVLGLLATGSAQRSTEGKGATVKPAGLAFINPAIATMRTPTVHAAGLVRIQPSQSRFTTKTAQRPRITQFPSSSTLSARPNDSDQESNMNEQDVRLIGWRSGTPKNLHVPHGLTTTQTALRKIVKNSLYHSIGLSDAIKTLLGKHTPFISFTVDNEPPSIFVNYEIKPHALNEFRSQLGLPEHIQFMKVRVAENSEPKYLITLNAYHVGGIAEGLRFDWSTYIDRGDGKPSYLMIKTDTNNHSMDPDNIITQPAQIAQYDNIDTSWHINLQTKQGNFQLNYALPTECQANETDLALPDRDWLGANDYVFWQNMICDRVFMDGSAFSEPLRAITVDIIPTDTPMKLLLLAEPEPVSAYAMQKPAHFVVQPWCNLDVAHIKKSQSNAPLSHFWEEIQKVFGR